MEIMGLCLCIITYAIEPFRIECKAKVKRPNMTFEKCKNTMTWMFSRIVDNNYLKSKNIRIGTFHSKAKTLWGSLYKT